MPYQHKRTLITLNDASSLKYTYIVNDAIVQLVEALRYKRKVAVSIPDWVIAVVIWPWGQFRLLTEMSTRVISWWVKATGA